MKRESPEIIAARNFATQAEAKLRQSSAFQQLNPTTQAALLRDLSTIRQAFDPKASAPAMAAKDPYAVSQDPGGSSWGTRGSLTYPQHSMMVSTVGVNVQADTELRAELFGEVKINFASETLPLERFVDQARLTLLQRHTRASLSQNSASKSAEPAASAASQTPAPGTVAAPTPPANSGIK
ncbi:MAG: hypothetical protein ACRENG_09775 [bacterium]